MACNCWLLFCVCCLCCCEKDKRRWWRMRTKKNNGRSVGSIPLELALSFFLCRLESLRNFDGRRSPITSLASWRLCSSEPKRRRCLVRARARRWLFVLVCFFFVRRSAVRSWGGALLMACAPRSALCARLGVVCAARFLLSIFLFHQSDTRMYFFPLLIWLVAVTAQTMNSADAAALNKTLTSLGCWESSACKTRNFNCSSTGVVGCNANGSVTTL